MRKFMDVFSVEECYDNMSEEEIKSHYPGAFESLPFEVNENIKYFQLIVPRGVRAEVILFAEKDFLYFWNGSKWIQN